jgi:hypothetical protein
MLTLRLKLNGSLKDKLTRKRNQCCDILESSRRRCDFALTMLLDAWSWGCLELSCVSRVGSISWEECIIEDGRVNLMGIGESFYIVHRTKESWQYLD